MRRFIARLSAVFGEPKGDLEAVMGELERVLAGFPPEDLDAAASDIIDSAAKKYWPMPKELADAARRARAKRINAMVTQGRAEQRDPFSRACQDEADKLVRAFEGVEKSIEFGWIAPLHDFCALHGRHPTPQETARIMWTAREIDRMLELFREKLANFTPLPPRKPGDPRPAFEESGPLLKSQIRMLESAKKRRQQLVDRLFSNRSVAA